MLKRARTFLVLLSPLALVACFAKTTSLGSADQSDGGGASSSSSSSSSGSSGSSGVDGGADVEAYGASCEVSTALTNHETPGCPTDQYCKTDVAGTCGLGHCTAKPPPPLPFCGAIECGCDGVLRCADTSRQAGVDVGTTQCGFPCGPSLTCNGLNEYCEHTPPGCGVIALDGGCPNTTDTYACRPVPSECTVDRSCQCLSQHTGSFGTCSGKDGKLTLDLPPPA